MKALWTILIALVAVFVASVNSKSIRLVGGTDHYGIIQIYVNETWLTLCAFPTFSNGDADIACIELGFTNGFILPLAAFGPYNGNYTAPFQGCSGTKASLIDCTFDEDYSTNVCSTQNTYYGSVWCSNQTLQNDYSVSIVSTNPGSYLTSYGPIKISKGELEGRVCTSYWSGSDANVTCVELGYLGGVSTIYPAEGNMPYLLTGIQCTGSEERLQDCSSEPQICYDTQLQAGVICYNSSEPKVFLEHQGTTYGRVFISVDGEIGSICNVNWSTQDSDVICRQLGYTTGDVLSGPHIPTNYPVFLSNLECSGAESSVTSCRSDGWRATPNCTSGEAAVRCYGNVRLSGGVTTSDVITGRVEVYQKSYWTTLCAHDFDMRDAVVVCRQLGYPKAKLLLSGIFGRPYYYAFTTSISCTGNETDLLECPHSLRACRYSEYASMMCINDMVSDDPSVSLETASGGTVLVTQYGIKGTVCRTGWDDNDAKVLCRQFGFKGGQVYGTPKLTARYMPVWLTNVQCSGSEDSVIQCGVSFDVTSECGIDRSSAGVVCYNDTGMRIRLVGGNAKNTGRVEVSRDGQWGTVCDNSWTGYDATVVCKQLGYGGGSAYRKSRLGSGTGPVWMDGLQCDGKEKSIFECPNHGWNITASACLSHRKDAGVYCYPWVKLSSSYFGAIKFWKDSSYGLVCADGFDHTSARVVCKEIGYTYAVVLCCSAMGKMQDQFTLIGARCQGNEKSLSECPIIKRQANCTGRDYAAVFCSHSNPTSSNVRSQIPTNGRGLIRLSYLQSEGYVCTEKFTESDADVVCRENGYPKGIAISIDTPPSDFQHSRKVRWANGLGCVGTERSIQQCAGMRIGQIGHCNQSVSAGVWCSRSSDDLQIRLANNTKGSEGRVEVFLDDTWGTVCGEITDKEAGVLCRQLSKRDGVALPGGTFGNGGTALIDQFHCDGSENALKECSLIFSATSAICPKAAAIKCYETIRIVDSDIVEFGRLELWHRSKWTSVCDDSFNDVTAGVICRYLGYVMGKRVCCSALGGKLQTNEISISNMTCDGSESDPSKCQMSYGSCSSGDYVSIHCMTTVRDENLTISILGSSYMGPLVASRYGLRGLVCHNNFTDVEARVACRYLGYKAGLSLKTARSQRLPVILGDVRCTDSIHSFPYCNHNVFGSHMTCGDATTIAGVLCYNNDVRFHIDGTSSQEGKASLIIDSQKIYMDSHMFTNHTANLFCKHLEFAGGSVTRVTSTVSETVQINCVGDEKSILQCPGSWDIMRTNMSVAQVKCHKDVRLVNDGMYYGAVQLYWNGAWQNICPEAFDAASADIVCRTLGFSSGIPLCCSPFGSLDIQSTVKQLQCNGKEKKLTNCSLVYDQNGVVCDTPGGYSSVVCYNGARSTDFSVSLRGEGYFSDVIITYMGISGRICKDGWDNNDAQVVCRQLNFVTGLAYNFYVEKGTASTAPYWLSNVNCTGKERSLADCKYSSEIGSVRSCDVRHYAGVLCLNNEGLNYRITGGDPNGRYGRVEIYVNRKWGTICDTYWGQEESRVICKQFGYRDGDTYDGSFKTALPSTIVYETRYDCSGYESSITECPHSSWYQAQRTRCLANQNDASVFCYQNVKLYGSVGRQRTEGAVVISRQDQWFLVCDNEFDDVAAKLVCKELGFVDGHARCCNKYGDISVPFWNETLQCDSNAKTLLDCMKSRACTSRTYASVECSFTVLPPKTTVPVTTTVSPTEMGASQTFTKNNSTVLIAVLLSCLALLVISIIIIVIAFRWRKSKAPNPNFHENVLERKADGSFQANNPLHDIDVDETHARINMDRQGSVVHYSPTAGPNEPISFSNLTYFSVQRKDASSNNEMAPADLNDHTIDHDDTIPIASDSKSSRSSRNIYIQPNFDSSHVYDNEYDDTPVVRIEQDGKKDNMRDSLAEVKEIKSPIASLSSNKDDDGE